MPQRNNRTPWKALGQLRWILAPFAGLYWALTALRNHLFDIDYKKSLAFTPLLISVGNLSVGGTGKSPMIEYLTRLLRSRYSLAILSRGYRRDTRGVHLATQADNARTLGDEPYQFYRKFNDESDDKEVVVAVGEERALAIPEIIHHKPAVKAILLDDAYQHRSVKADLQLLLTTYQRPFYRDRILPLGLLREGRQGARRADAVVVTKCPADLPSDKMQAIEEQVKQYTRVDVPVFFTAINYQSPVAVSGTNVAAMPAKALLFSGLANADLFEAYAREHFEVTSHIKWGDHHRYTESDRRLITDRMQAEGAEAALTTEKDMVKLLAPTWSALPLYYLPIGIFFLQEEQEFQGFVEERIRLSEKV